MCKMKKIIFLFLSYTAFAFNTLAQEGKNLSTQKWGIETELFQPFYPTVQIIRIQATRSLLPENAKNQGDLILGAYIRPNVKHDVVEKINEYMLVLGYRQYVWKGLHIEAKSNMGYAWGTKNLIDGKDYETPTWFWESNVGYKINIKKKNSHQFYLTPQFGGLGNIVADIGPRGGKPDNFLHGNIYLGINF